MPSLLRSSRPRQSWFDEAMRQPAPVKQPIVDVFSIVCEDLVTDKTPEDVATVLGNGWELRVYRLACGHAMGPYLLRVDGQVLSGEMTCTACRGSGLRAGNRKNKTGTSMPEEQSTKLTRAQLETLRRSAEPDGVRLSTLHRPIIRLLALGLVESREQLRGHRERYVATDQGKALLAWKPSGLIPSTRRRST